MNPPQKISLTLQKQISTLDKVVFLEPININCLTALIESNLLIEKYDNTNYSQKMASQLYANEKKQLVAYSKLYDPKLNACKVEYIKPSRHKYGRVFPTKSLGLTSLSKQVRNTLIKDTHIDLDLCNAQPAIVYNICIANNIPCPFNTKYNNNREEILANMMTEYDVSRNTAKGLFIRLAFFGTFYGWCKDNKLDVSLKPNDFIIGFKAELESISLIVKKANPDLYETCKRLKENKGETNIIGSFFSLYLQEYETRIVECAIEWLSNKTNILDYPHTELKAITYEFDGIKLLKENVNKYDGGYLQLIEDLNRILFEKTGFTMIFEEKKIEKFFEIEYSPIIPTDLLDCDGVESDLEAAEKLYKMYPHWVYCKGELYVFNMDTGMWDNDITAYFNIIKKYTNELYVLVETDKGMIKTNNSYGSTLSLMQKIIPLIKTCCGNDNWLKQKQYSSLGKILFNNGYYNFKEMKFYSKAEYGYNPDILFVGKIHHDFEPFSDDDMEYMNDIQQRLFYNALGEEVGDYFILNLARGLAGDMMKRILFGLGGTNSGKSVLTTAVMLSCGDYVGSFNAENLAYRNSSNDEAQIMRWAMLLRFKRIIFSNEMKSTVELNGNMIKKVSSGGDTLIGRNHCKAEEEFITHFLSVCLANDLPKITPYDDAVNGRVKIVSYNKSFVDEPENEFELTKDYNIEAELKTVRFQKVFVGLLIREYCLYMQNGEPTEPAGVVQAKNDWVGQEKNVVDTFVNDFDITNNETDYVTSKDIELWITDKKLGITMKKFGMELRKYCAIKGFDKVDSINKKINGKVVKVWTGINMIEEIYADNM